MVHARSSVTIATNNMSFSMVPYDFREGECSPSRRKLSAGNLTPCSRFLVCQRTARSLSQAGRWRALLHAAYFAERRRRSDSSAARTFACSNGKRSGANVNGDDAPEYCLNVAPIFFFLATIFFLSP